MRRFSPSTWGGTENVVFSVSRELQRRNVESCVFCTAMLAEKGLQTLEKIPVRRFSYIFPWLFLSRNAKRRLELKGGSPLSLQLFRALLFEKEVSLIHTHVQHRLGGMARTAARIRRIPYIVSIHGGHFSLPADQVDKMMQPFRGKPEWGKIFGALFGSRRVLDDAAAIICVGQNETAAFRERFPGKPIHYLPNGVDVQRYSSADGEHFRKQYGFKPREKLVLCVSRIDYQKNQLDLIRSFADFSASHPDHRLVLLGPVTVEAYRDEINAEVRRLELDDRVLLIEGLAPDDPLLPAAYKAAEFFVLPSIHEPFGMVVLEAWAAGLPVLANRVGGIPGFVRHEETGLLVEPENLDQMVAGMCRLADDVGLRTDLSRCAYAEAARNYEWSKIVDRLLEVYEQTMSANRAG